jgi:hypothetical protein
MTEKAKKFIATTGAGIAMYPWLTKPDTKFNAGGEYKLDLQMPREDAEALITKLEEIRDAAFVEAVAAAKPQDKKKITKAEVFHEVYDDNGDATGDIFLRFKMKAMVTPKGKEPFEQKPKGFDAGGKPWDEKKAVYGGSTLKVNFEAVPYGPDTNKKVGLTLRLRAFQVLELVSSSGGSASGFGFDVDESYEEEDNSADSSSFDAPDDGADEF